MGPSPTRQWSGPFRPAVNISTSSVHGCPTSPPDPETGQISTGLTSILDRRTCKYLCKYPFFCIMICPCVSGACTRLHHEGEETRLVQALRTHARNLKRHYRRCHPSIPVLPRSPTPTQPPSPDYDPTSPSTAATAQPEPTTSPYALPPSPVVERQQGEVQCSGVDGS